MKLLVTGGSGFIGSNFIHYWLSHHPDDYIINFDKLTYAGSEENNKLVADNPHYRFVQADICDRAAVDAIMGEIDIVVNYAAETHVDRSIVDPKVFMDTNIIGTYTLLESARQNGLKRFHHISTDEVFGTLQLEDGKKFNETTPYQPRSPYSASKAASDHIVRSYHTTFGLPITISNCSNNYGPFCYPEKLIPLAITNLLEGKNVPVYGDGLYVRDWLYVEDHASAVEAILLKGEIGETYFIGSTVEDISNLDLIKKILVLMNEPESKIEYVKDRPGHDRRYAIDWSKIHQELGWEPEIGLDEGLRKTIEWYKTNMEWWKKIKSDASFKSFA